MKKYFALLTIVIFLSMLFACGGGKYAQARKAMEKMVSATNDFVNGIEKANDAESTAAAINAYADDMKDIAAEMKVIKDKYPEIIDQQNPPEELKEVSEQAQEAMTKMMGVMMKIAKYAHDEKVVAAQKRLDESMSALK